MTRMANYRLNLLFLVEKLIFLALAAILLLINVLKVFIMQAFIHDHFHILDQHFFI